MVTKQRAIELWEDHVGDSGRAPTDVELHLFAIAVEEEARKPFVKLHKRWLREAKSNRTLARNHAAQSGYYNLYMDAAEQFKSFAKRLKNRLDAQN